MNLPARKVNDFLADEQWASEEVKIEENREGQRREEAAKQIQKAVCKLTQPKTLTNFSI